MRKGGRKKAAHTDELLSMALVGYESAKESIEKKMSEIRKMIDAGGRAVSAAVDSFTATPKKKRVLSAAARKRIATAQKKRWAAAKKAAISAVKTAKTKMKRTARRVKAKASEVKSEVPS
jgi:hypothetical protein